MAALEVLQKQVDSGQVRQVKGNSYLEDLRSGNAIAVIGWSGDILLAQFERGGRQLQVRAARDRRHALVGQPDGPDRRHRTRRTPRS